MTHVEIKYDPVRRSLKVYYNGKLYGGMIGKIAEQRYQAIKAEMDRIDGVVKKAHNNGHKEKTPKV